MFTSESYESNPQTFIQTFDYTFDLCKLKSAARNIMMRILLTALANSLSKQLECPLKKVIFLDYGYTRFFILRFVKSKLTEVSNSNLFELELLSLDWQIWNYGLLKALIWKTKSTFVKSFSSKNSAVWWSARKKQSPNKRRFKNIFLSE